MAARSNAGTELTRLWLEHRHGCLVRESVQVPVRRSYSDIDFIAVHRTQEKILLPNGANIDPRLAVETKDEHDGPSGGEFGKLLRADFSKIMNEGFIPLGTVDINFTMLKAEHFHVASKFLGTTDFDRLFIVHALDDTTRAEVCSVLATRHRIHWLTIPEMVTDLFHWYESVDKAERVSLRNTLSGDLFHLLVGYCGFGPIKQ